MLVAGLAALTALALAFALVALWRRQAAPDEEDRRQTVVELYRARTSELAKELAETDVLEPARAELEAALLDDLSTLPEPENRWGGAKLFPMAAAVVTIVGVCAWVYLSIGDPTADRLRGVDTLLHGSLDPAALDDWETRLAERLDAKPDDAASWYLAGHVHMQKRAYQLAAEAFAKAHGLQGDDPSIDAYWLQARYMAAGGRLDGVSVQIAERIVQRDPSNAVVLELLAVARYRAGDFAQSLSLLNRALSAARQPDAQLALIALMGRVREQVEVRAPAIDVAVSAEPGAPNDATVFVIARPVGGGMPFAVVRRPSALLPFDVRLDDYVAMNPAVPLSAAGDVEVVVRLSRSGQAMAQPGDWQWQSQQITLDAQTSAQLDARLSPPS